jgi:hypothetical protein
MGVVISAEQGHVVDIGGAAKYPIDYVVPIAPAGWMGAAGKAAAGVAGD